MGMENTSHNSKGSQAMTKYDIAANITIAGLDGFRGRMSAKTQRDIFGRKAFGRKLINIDNTGQGRVFGCVSCSFGTDSNFFELSFDEISSGKECSV